MAGIVAGESDSSPPALALLGFVRDVVRMSAGMNSGGEVFKRDCTDLVRRIVLLTHLFEEIRDFKGLEFDASTSSSSSSSSAAVTARDSSPFPWLSDLVAALKDAKRLIFIASTFRSCSSSVSQTLCLFSYGFFFVQIGRGEREFRSSRN